MQNRWEIMKSSENSTNDRPGDPLEALWRRLGCPRGPRGEFGSEKLVRWTPPGPLMGLIVCVFFDVKTVRFCSCILLWKHVGVIVAPFSNPKLVKKRA